MNANKVESNFEGVWTAIGTPFTTDYSIDWQAFERLLAMQTDAAVAGVVVCGTTGESPSLTAQEKLSLIRRARAVLPPSVRLMAGTGGSNTEQSLELSKLAVDAGADSLLIVTPPYNKPSAIGLKRHFSRIATSVKVPVCLYHVPGRTAQRLSEEMVASICQVPGVDLVKEASGDVAFFSRALQKCENKTFLTGDDPTFLPSLAVGGKGVISVVSNIFPNEMVALMSAQKNGDNVLALRYHKALLPFIDALFCESNPGPLKAAFHALGLAANILRLPLAEVTEANYNLIRTTLHSAQADLSRITAI